MSLQLEFHGQHLVPALGVFSSGFPSPYQALAPAVLLFTSMTANISLFYRNTTYIPKLPSPRPTKPGPVLEILGITHHTHLVYQA